MNNIYDAKFTIKEKREWEKILDDFLNELSNHLGMNLEKRSYFIEEQVEGEASFGCHVDFRGTISTSLQLELCGILCLGINWNERAHVGTYLLYYHEGIRLAPNADDESVSYIPRENDGWGYAHMEVGEGGEWSNYNTPRRVGCLSI
ncbi:hypothetical protein MNBD_GAMMA12-958 [hydrothermal vent metagenome]|uniref:Uncharacterized protein n=1 Tax=hydrothermal vent metagenome TaxID=652676 RepID=A0A3B0YN61_9ZZZZ